MQNLAELKELSLPLMNGTKAITINSADNQSEQKFGLKTKKMKKRSTSDGIEALKPFEI